MQEKTKFLSMTGNETYRSALDTFLIHEVLLSASLTDSSLKNFS